MTYQVFLRGAAALCRDVQGVSVVSIPHRRANERGRFVGDRGAIGIIHDENFEIVTICWWGPETAEFEPLITRLRQFADKHGVLFLVDSGLPTLWLDPR